MAAVCILVYIAAVAFGAVRIIVDIGERRNLAEREFGDLADRASSSAVFTGFMSDAYQESIKDFLNTSSTLLGIIITSSGAEQAFEKRPGSGIVWTGNTPRFKIGIGISGEPLNLPLRIDGQRNVTLRAVYGYIDYRYFQRVLRDTLLAVLAALIVAFVTLLVELGAKKKTPQYRTGETSDSAVSEGGLKQDEQSFSAPAEEGSPQGLYTARGNIGWESYTHDRLYSELHRCASFEQDLTFLVMEFRDTLPFYRQFANEAVSFFQMRDLIFEQGHNGISIILPNLSLEKGMAKAEEFRGRVIDKLPQSFEGRSSLCIGLTSRAGRLVDAKRLMLEAFTALEKALADEVSHVVAFKSDPEKYREFIRQNAGNS